MLDINELLQSLTIKQKISLVSNRDFSLESKEGTTLIPSMNYVNYKDLLKSSKCPHISLILNSFSEEVVNEYAKLLAKNALEKNCDVVVFSIDDLSFNVSFEKLILSFLKSLASYNVKIGFVYDEKTANTSLINISLKTIFASNCIDCVLTKSMDAKRVRSALNFNKLLFTRSFLKPNLLSCLDGHNSDSPIVIEEKIGKYEEYKQAVAEGNIGQDVLDDAVKSGSILSLEILDAAVKNVLEFINSFKNIRVDSEDLDVVSIYKRIAVLMKNDGVLPLLNNEKVCLVGDVFNNDCCSQNDDSIFFNFKDVLKSYNISEADNANISIVTIEPTKDEITLSPEHSNLINSEVEKGRKVVVIVGENRLQDLKFMASCAAVIFAPLSNPSALKAICLLLSGCANDFGHLSNIVESFNIGYGLSYSNMNYSNYSLQNQSLTFTLTNESDFDGEDLVSISCVSSTNGLRKQIGNYKIVCKSKGNYTVSINFYKEQFNSIPTHGSSIELYINGVYIDKFVLSSSFFSSLLESINKEVTYRENGISSNVIADFDFSQQEKNSKTKSKSKKVLIPISLFIYFNALFIFLLVILILTGSDTLGYLLLTVAIIDIILITIWKWFKQKSRPSDMDSLKLSSVRKDKFLLYLFDDKSTPHFEDSDLEETDGEIILENANDVSMLASNFDESLSFVEIINDIKSLAKSKGLDIDNESIQQVISAIASFRLIVIENSNNELVDDFFKLLISYFGGVGCVEKLKNNCKSFDDMIQKIQGNRLYGTDFAFAIDSAQANPQNICLNVFDNIDEAALTNCFALLKDYYMNPNVNTLITLTSKYSNQVLKNVRNGKLNLPKNLWFILMVNGGLQIPSELSAYACNINIKINYVEPVKIEKKSSKVLSLSFMNSLLIDSKENYFIDEDLWKKIDAFVVEVNKREKFEISNLLQLKMENYSSVFLNCGASQMEVLDEMLANCILRMITITAKDAIVSEDSLLTVVDKIFNIDNVPLCAKVLKGE